MISNLNIDDEKYSLFLISVSCGFSNRVINIAEKYPSIKYKIVSYRGTLRRQIEKLFNIILTPEKEYVLILAHSENSEKIGLNLTEEIGIATECKGVIYTENLNKLNFEPFIEYLDKANTDL